MDVSPQTIFLLLISILHVISLFDKYEACPADVYYLQIPHRLPQGGYHPPYSTRFNSYRFGNSVNAWSIWRR